MNTVMSYFPKIPIRRCQEEDCLLKISGDQWEYSNREDGFITNCIGHNHISFYSGDLKTQILKLDYLPLGLLLPLTLSATEMIIYKFSICFSFLDSTWLHGCFVISTKYWIIAVNKRKSSIIKCGTILSWVLFKRKHKLNNNDCLIEIIAGTWM